MSAGAPDRTAVELPPWQPTAAHFRATAIGVLGALAALVLHRTDLLVVVTPLLVVVTWSWWRRPREVVRVTAALGHRTLREGEATAVRARVTLPVGVDEVLFSVPSGLFLEQDPPLGIRVLGADDAGPVADDAGPGADDAGPGAHPGGGRPPRRATGTVVLRSTRWGVRAVGPLRW
ncbi:MAG: hypothetical protein ABJA89_03325, partial [Lapillicoccus sp.]